MFLFYSIYEATSYLVARWPSLPLTPDVSQVARLGDRVAEVMGQEGVSSEEVLKALAEERERYYKDHY